MALEGKEVSGKIGDMGEYGIDLADTGELNAEASVKKHYLSDMIKLTGSLKIETNVVGLIALQAEKSENKMVKMIAAKLVALTSKSQTLAAMQEEVKPVA